MIADPGSVVLKPKYRAASDKDLRDWFAGMALAGFWAAGPRTNISDAARLAYEQADKMLEARGE